MNCREVTERLGSYVDDALGSDAVARLEAHLTTCDSCRHELAVLRRLAEDLSRSDVTPVPEEVWRRIEGRLDLAAAAPVGLELGRTRFGAERTGRFAGWRPMRAAAAVLFVAGLGAWFIVGPGEEGPAAQASAVDFSTLLDALPLDPQKAFRRFLVRYDAVPLQPRDASSFAPALNFHAPESLPGGFRRIEMFGLRFGDSPGIAVRYDRNGEFLAALFHRAVHDEDYGTHRDNPCIVGMHRGHKVEVGPWRLVHVTDPTTCHCVLSRLDEAMDLPPILAAVAPNVDRTEPAAHHGHR